MEYVIAQILPIDFEGHSLSNTLYLPTYVGMYVGRHLVYRRTWVLMLSRRYLYYICIYTVAIIPLVRSAEIGLYSLSMTPRFFWIWGYDRIIRHI